MESVAKHDQRVMELVILVLGRPQAERQPLLDSACADDSELHREVQEMVEGEERMASFLRHPMISLTEFPRPFKAGDVVAERFEILREIGEGGMGVVFEALDRKRGLRIAIKAAKPGFHRLLSPELEGALAVRHPNVCRVNEIYTVRTDYGEIDFLTMELLEGETLGEALRARGKFSTSEALAIARQLCAGLYEAHRCGVIHRDLKPANIYLCLQAGGAPRAVITDFGLAGATAPNDEIAGTPNYMAPELWLGQSTSTASDIYALGVILYQMTVCPDLGGAGPIPSPQSLRTLPSRWRNAVSRSLTADPLLRLASATEVLNLLEPKPRRWMFALAVPVVALLLISLSLFIPQVRFKVRDLLGLSPNVRLIVLPPQQTDAASAAGGILLDLSERLSHWRSGDRLVAVVSPSEAQRASVQTIEQARSMHATHALETLFHKDGQDLLVQGAVIDLQTLAHVRDFSARYNTATLGALPDALTGLVTGALELSGSAADPLNPAATVAYDNGLYSLQDDRDVAQAVVQFQNAVKLDPRSPRPLAGLATAEIERFNQTKEPSFLVQARKDLDAGQILNPDSAWLHLEGGQVSEAYGHYEAAREEFLRATQLEPRAVNARVRLAEIYDKLIMPEKAIETYREAIALDPNNYQPHQFLGSFYFNHGRFAEAAEQFRQATQLAPGLMYDFANLAAALICLGHYAEAEQALSTSLKLRETPMGLNNMGDLLITEGRDAEAIPYLERAAALDPHGYLWQLNLGDANRHLGRREPARAAYHKGMKLALADLAENPRQGSVRAMVGYFAAQLGQRDRAQDEIRQAIQLSPGDNQVILLAVSAYEALGMRERALAALAGASGQLLAEMKINRDLAEFSQDLRFKKIEARESKGR
jgi:serine/threonine protein kinase/tetratricopeptide (TPR) repeat protein